MQENKTIHTPVLLQKSIEMLNIRKSGIYLDCTLGDGGHSSEILKKGRELGGISLISLDYDQTSIDFVRNKHVALLKDNDWKIVRENFSKLQEILTELETPEVDGILFDLGLSSRQIETKSGFSFQTDSNLDMRMDDRLGVKAVDLLKALSASELELIFSKYGEERYSKRIAKAIKRDIGKFQSNKMTTLDLVELIRRVVPANYREGSKNPATRVFQALRITVNDELNNLESGLNSALSVVSTGGRVVVISYHSLEDRIVKTMFKESESLGIYKILTEKPIITMDSEISQNPRSRSAKLRVIEKV